FSASCGWRALTRALPGAATGDTPPATPPYMAAPSGGERAPAALRVWVELKDGVGCLARGFWIAQPEHREMLLLHPERIPPQHLLRDGHLVSPLRQLVPERHA